MPRSLDLDRLSRFQPESPVQESAIETKSAFPVPSQDGSGHVGPAPARWPSREPVRDGQVSIKAPLEVIDRFRALCRDDRRTYADMLGILMDVHETRDRERR